MIQIVLNGYEHIRTPKANVLVATSIASQIRMMLDQGTLYDQAALVPHAQQFSGRAPVYVFPLGPSGWRIAVRHAMRGGMIGKLIRDRFLPPTRGLRELVNSIRLRAAGIPTPEVLAIATYPAGGPFRRGDVITRYVEDSADLAAVLGDTRNDAQRHPILDAVAKLLAQLTTAGAQHADLNLKNILITATDDGYLATVLDVDRVHFHSPGDPMVRVANMDRLVRSLRKWRDRITSRTGALQDSDLEYLAQSVSKAEAAMPPESADTE
jgi:hypothetical protein